MRPSRVILATGILILGLHLVALELFRKPDGRVIFGDATHHYVQLRSLVFDRDLDFENDYLGMYGVQAGDPGTEWLDHARTPTGRVRNYMPVGPALLWTPLYLVALAIGSLLSVAGVIPRPDGFDRFLEFVPGITGILAATLSAGVSFRMAERRQGPRAALVATLAVWLGSHALYYTLVSPAYSHAASMLTSAIFFAHWLRVRQAWTPGKLAASGALAGLAALMRWQDAIFIVVPLVEALRWPTTMGRRMTSMVATVGAFFVAFSPQMAVWTVLYGQPLALPQGAGFMQWTSPHLLAVLFSDYHGLFTWAPLLLPAVVGLATAFKKERGTGLPVAAVLICSWYANAAVLDWWAGEAFGARRFLSLFPLFVLGLAAWLGRYDARPRVTMWPYVLVTFLVGANVLLFLQYQLFMKGLGAIAPYPHAWFDMYLTRFVVPFRLIARWLG